MYFRPQCDGAELSFWPFRVILFIQNMTKLPELVVSLVLRFVFLSEHSLTKYSKYSRTSETQRGNLVSIYTQGKHDGLREWPSGTKTTLEAERCFAYETLKK